jgi:small redox-active disulfide protein 2
MNIKVLGPGCAKCHKLEKLVREVVAENKLDAEVEYIQDMTKIMQYPVLTTPGLVIDEEVVCTGRVPSKAEIAEFIDKVHS